MSNFSKPDKDQSLGGRPIEAKTLLAIGLGVTAIACVIRITILAAGDFGLLLDPFMIFATALILSPILAAGVWAARSTLGFLGLVPLAVVGNILMYSIRHDTSSSTSAIGLVILPFYEWVFLGICGLAVWFLSKLK